MCTPVTPAVPYLLLDLQGVQWAVENSRGARKLTRTPHVNKKKIKKNKKKRPKGKLLNLWGGKKYTKTADIVEKLRHRSFIVVNMDKSKSDCMNFLILKLASGCDAS